MKTSQIWGGGENRSGDLQILGYIIFRDVVKPDDIEFARSAMTEENSSGMDYISIHYYITDILLKIINRELNWRSDFVKFRASDANNFADAAVYHRDIIPRNTDIINTRSHTLLSYLDDASVSVYPGSHLTSGMSHIDALGMYKSAETIKMRPGDLLLFNSCLIHSGLYTKNVKHRRLIQIFDVFSSKESMIDQTDRTLHIPRWSDSDILLTINRIPIVIELMRFFTFMNVATGNSCERLKDFDFYASEGVRPRLTVLDRERRPNNQYVLTVPTYDADPNDIENFSWYYLRRPLLVYAVITVLVLIMVIITVKKSLRCN
jgi:hypothetical protein